jgi:branched-chain amino acid transport system ATP-binding protein
MVLEVEDLVAGYGKVTVLKGISLSLNEGQSLAVLGANGAGKSTLMKVLTGLLRPSRGVVILNGRDITSTSPVERAVLGIALVPEGRLIFSSLSIEENLMIGATALRKRYGTADARRRTEINLERIYGMFPVLGTRRRDRGSNLSGGQQQMLAIGRALAAEPQILLMDEPCLGLAPKVGREVYESLGQIRDEGRTVVVVDESAHRALDFADRACVIKLGTKVAEDDAAALKRDDELLQAYFGVAPEAIP